MDSIAPTKAVQDVQPAQSASKSAGDAPRRENEQRATGIYPPQLTTDAMSVQFDEASERFVHVTTDPVTHDVVMTYPSESQLAYSRAIMAYLRALAAR